MSKNDRIRRRREERRNRAAAPGAMAGFCADCCLITEAPFVGMRLDITYRDDQGNEARVVRGPSVAMVGCAGCDRRVPVINAISVPNAFGDMMVFGISPAQRDAAITLAHDIAKREGITADEIADAIEDRAPWLLRLAQQIRAEPLAATGVGVGVAGLAATLILGVVGAIDPQAGITEEQLERILEDQREQFQEFVEAEPASEAVPELGGRDDRSVGGGP